MALSELPQGILESRLARETQKETELLHSRLRDIAQAVINDDQVFSCGEEKMPSMTSLSPRSGRSPVRRVNNSSRPASRGGSPFADATFSAVQAALSKRQLQIHDLKTKLENSRDTNVAFKKQIDDAENEKRRLEQMCNDFQLQLENIRRTADETSRERDHSKQQLETTNYQKSTLEKARAVNLSFFFYFLESVFGKKFTAIFHANYFYEYFM